MRIVNHTSRTIYVGLYKEDERAYTFTLQFLGVRVLLNPQSSCECTHGGLSRVQAVIWDSRAFGAPLAGPRMMFTSRPASFAEDANGMYLYNYADPPRPMDKIEHVFVLMLENRSFDHLLGWLYADKHNAPDRNIPAETPPRYDGLTENTYWNTLVADDHDKPGARRVYANKGAKTRTKPNPNPPEVCPRFIEQMFGTDAPKSGAEPNMWGFMQAYAKRAGNTDVDGVMECYTPDQVPSLSTLARAFAVCDRWFGSAPTETFPNRAFLHAGTSFGRLNNMDGQWNEGDYDHFPDNLPNFAAYAGKRTIFDVLEENHIPFGLFTYSTFKMTQLGYQFFTIPQKLRRPFHPIWELPKWLVPGGRIGVYQLPWYIFIEPEGLAGANDQHPPQDVGRGDNVIRQVYNAIRESPVWHKSLLIITHDEHGGCYDHVAPPRADPPDSTARQFPVGGIDPLSRFGPRVPAVIVSPYVEPGTVFRSPGVPHDHTSILSSLRDWIFGPSNASPEAFLGHNPRIEKAPTVWSVLTRPVARSEFVVLPAETRAHEGVDSTPLTLEQVAYVAHGEATRRVATEGGVNPNDDLQKQYDQVVRDTLMWLDAQGVRTTADLERVFHDAAGQGGS